MILPLSKRLELVALLAGYGLLLVETRFEHRVVMGTQWQPWIPVIFSASALITGMFGLAFIKTFGRKVLLCLFAVSMIIGVVGFWLHGKGELAARLEYLIASLFGPVGQIDTSEMSNPPLLAPLAFSGLGLIGLILTLGWSHKNGKTNNTKKH